jgi:S-(hydroxymethyl)glutathione dehydrogenase/alcohol dehydrogenase
VKTRGAIIRSTPGEYEVVDLDLDDPARGEVLVKLAASGLCHSDDHVATGDIPVEIYPFCGGTRAPASSSRSGPNTKGYEVGDHVVFSFLPGCGKCRWCASACRTSATWGASLLTGARADDPAASG